MPYLSRQYYPPPIAGAATPPGTPLSNTGIVVTQTAMFAVGAGLAVFAFAGPKHR